MKIDVIIKELIKVYPIKDSKELVLFNWNKAADQKNEILGFLDTDILSSLTSEANSLYGESKYLLVVGSTFGTGLVSTSPNGKYPVETYYLKTGVMFGEGDDHSGRFLFELNALYHKNGKFIDFGSRKTKLKKLPFEFYRIVLRKLYEIYQIPGTVL